MLTHVASHKSTGDRHAEKWTPRILVKVGGNKDRQSTETGAPHHSIESALGSQGRGAAHGGKGGSWLPCGRAGLGTHVGILSRNECDRSGLGPSSDH